MPQSERPETILTLADFFPVTVDAKRWQPHWTHPASPQDWVMRAGQAYRQRVHQERWLWFWIGLGMLGCGTVSFMSTHGALFWAFSGCALALAAMVGVLIQFRRTQKALGAEWALQSAQVNAKVVNIPAVLLQWINQIECSEVPILKGDLAELSRSDSSFLSLSK